MSGYEHQSVDHDASIRVEATGPDVVTVTITRGDRKPRSITMWASEFADMAASITPTTERNTP